ncbi:hypothetical protein HJB56_28825 [Rhizobium lentis]|uniref:GTP pyrophosphokinase n=1 Tax=Rhizobium lentis TaxID=1138194 RepID=UPI001C82C743|nr:hypothetical protein [Rhizobium lentis]MBX5086732.1 hypothetical protein [Rhizobium lentis]MBX5099377.1 hypothetical protein [Rhizobium lentis]MBX5124294.1 hypothetical protein [Rhizobium lentis]
MSNFDDLYEKNRPTLERAREGLHALLREAADGIEDRKLVRVEFDDVRIKEPSSLQRKARRHGWTDDDAFAKCPDLIGGRVVCNNIEDVYRFEELLTEILPIGLAISRQDFIKNPTPQGYRALHLNVRIELFDGFFSNSIPCEIQIRTRLQDAWAELSHGDIYKQDGLPEDLRDRARDLASLLATADGIATSIRERVQRVTEPPETVPDLDRLSMNSIAFIFKDVFGRAPPNYVVNEALALCDELAIDQLGGLIPLLKRQDFREKLAKAYSEFLPVTIRPETIFPAALYGLSKGEARALRYVRAQARREFKEIDAIARREMLSLLPATAEDLIEELEDPRGETDILSLASALGAANGCGYCSTPVVDPYTFAEAATRHYGLSGDEADETFERIEQALLSSGVDTGGPDGDPSVCSSCAHRLAKDD